MDRAHHFYWCKVPKAASTSWISLLLSDREFANLQTSIGRQHMYLRYLSNYAPEQEWLNFRF